jgi:hypothetical protein
MIRSVILTSLLVILTSCNHPANLNGRWKLDKTASATRAVPLTNELEKLSGSLPQLYLDVLSTTGTLINELEVKENTFLILNLSCSLRESSKTKGALCTDNSNGESKYIGLEIARDELTLYLVPSFPLVYKR